MCFWVKSCSNLDSYSHECNQNKSVFGISFCQINPWRCNQLFEAEMWLLSADLTGGWKDVCDKTVIFGTAASVYVHGSLLQSFKYFLCAQLDTLRSLGLKQKREKNLQYRYDQWMTVYLLSVCPPSLPFNPSSHPSRHLCLSAVVCLFTPSALPPATLMIFILCPSQK